MTRRARRAIGRQGGWAGLLVLLLALVVVGFLMRTVLKQMTSDAPPAGSTESAASVGAPDAAARPPLEQARAAEAAVLRAADEARQRIEEADTAPPPR